MRVKGIHLGFDETIDPTERDHEVIGDLTKSNGSHTAHIPSSTERNLLRNPQKYLTVRNIFTYSLRRYRQVTSFRQKLKALLFVLSTKDSWLVRQNLGGTMATATEHDFPTFILFEADKPLKGINEIYYFSKIARTCGTPLARKDPIPTAY